MSTQGIRESLRQLCSTQPAVFEAFDMSQRLGNNDVPTDSDADVTVPTDSDSCDGDTILRRWAAHRRRQEWEKVGRWRPLSEIKKVPKIQDVKNKRDGLLVLTGGNKWNLYFSLDASFSFEVLRSGIEAHPLTTIGRIEPTSEPTGHTDDHGNWIPHHHLSNFDYRFSCCRIISV